MHSLLASQDVWLSVAQEDEEEEEKQSERQYLAHCVIGEDQKHEQDAE